MSIHDDFLVIHTHATALMLMESLPNNSQVQVIDFGKGSVVY